MTELLSIIIKDNQGGIEVNINCNLNREYDFEMRIALILLDDIMKSGNNENNFNKRKEFIEKLESFINCIRFELMDFKDIFKENKDNLDIVMTFKSSINLEKEFEDLIKKYLEYKNGSSFKVNIKRRNVNAIENETIDNLTKKYEFIKFNKE